MVDDPSEYVDELLADRAMKKKAEAELAKRVRDHESSVVADEEEAVEPPTLEEVVADLERQRLFDILERLVQWESTTDKAMLQEAQDEIRKSWQRTCANNADHPRAAELFNSDEPPAFHDPFAGGGALPLEAQRLGFEAHASDLNPVAVLINKAMIEIPPKFANQPPINPEARSKEMMLKQQWEGAEGLAEDVRYYGQQVRDEAERRIGHLYPKIKITAEMADERPDLKRYAGKELKVIAWLWARTVKSPNPAFADVEVPLVSNFMLSTKKGREAYIEPMIDGDKYWFKVRVGIPPNMAVTRAGTGAGPRQGFRCLLSGSPVNYPYIREEGKAKRMGTRLMAVVAEGTRERIYLDPSVEQSTDVLESSWTPDLVLPDNPRDFKTPNYGLITFGDLFTPRQLVALSTFSDLITEMVSCIKSDVSGSHLADDEIPLDKGGTGAIAYAEAVSMYLVIALSRLTDICNSLCSWRPSKTQVVHLFVRQAIPMVWDFAENNVFGNAAGDYGISLANMIKALRQMPAARTAVVYHADAQSQSISDGKFVSTDPPYYDNVGYADLSDFFYVWLRRPLGAVFPDLFATLSAPRAEELVATPYRHGSYEEAETFFLQGMTKAMQYLSENSHPIIPVTIYYAFKQTENTSNMGIVNTGWEIFLDAVIQAGFTISGTWPIRTELGNRVLAIGTNSLASSIILVCRRRSQDAPLATYEEFIAALENELPRALAYLQGGNIAPVDLAQAIIGPGMAVYTKYARVLNTKGEQLSVREALGLINRILDEIVAAQEGDFDSDTRWAVAWYEQYGFSNGEYGVAETLAKAKNTSIGGLEEAGILAARAGNVCLFRPEELPEDWSPATGSRFTIWETVHHLIRELEAGGEMAAAELVHQLGSIADTARELAYRLYGIADRAGRAKEALSYNSLVQSWPEISRMARFSLRESE